MTRARIRKSAAVAIMALVALVLAQAPPLARADAESQEGRDQERARRALERGEVRPFIEILEIVGSRIDGEIVKTEFSREDGLWVYEIRFITRSGRMSEIYVNALTGRIIRSEDE